MNVDELKGFIDQRFTAHEKRVDERFDDVAERVDGLTTQVKETNGRLRKAESTLADHGPRLDTARRDLDDLRRDAREDAPQQGDSRGITQRDVTLVLSTLGIAWAAVKVVGWISAAAVLVKP